jgi:site-specific recombinase XerD
MAQIDTVARQNRLDVLPTIRWHKLATGQHVGVRRTGPDSFTWFARAYAPGSGPGAQSKHKLGEFPDLPRSERFDAACKAAREWIAHRLGGGATKAITVKEAGARYVKHLQRNNGLTASLDAEGFMRRLVDDDPIGRIPVDKLQPRHVKEWRDRLNARDVLSTRGPRCKIKTKPKPRKLSAASIDRNITALRAVLNLAKHDRYVLTDAAWARQLEPLPKSQTSRRRVAYLDRTQRAALLDALPADLREFARALCLLPLRPGALAKATVGHFNAEDRTLRIDADKAHDPRYVPLPDAVVELFKGHAKDALPAAPLFRREGGTAWNKDAWKGPVLDAVATAKLPKGTTMYALRHSTITDLVTGGLDLFTVAKVSGTSVAMIEAHYGHIQAEHARKALAGLAL